MSKKILFFFVSMCLVMQGTALAQFKPDAENPGASKTAETAEKVDAADAPLVISLEQALQIAMSENIAVRVADQEILRSEYAKKGSYSSLFPQVNGSGNFQRTIKKQVMYFDMDMGSMFPGGDAGGEGEGGGDASSQASSSKDGIEIGRWNTFDAGIVATMPIVNFQLWESLKISGKGVDIAVEKARESRLEMVTQVKQAYYAVLLAKEAFEVYKSVYENAVENYQHIRNKYNAQKASELEMTRAKSSMASAIPNVYNAESTVMLSLWQLKAVIGMDLDKNIDVAGTLADYSETMFKAIHENDSISLENNTTVRQLALQAEQLAQKVKMDKLAYAPTLGVNFKYSYNVMANDFNFSEYRWTPYSFIGFSLNIPIFSGGKRFHDIKQSKVQQTQLNLQKIDVERKLKIAINQYLTTMETSMKSYDASCEAVELAQKAYDIAAKSYDLGKSTITDLDAAQLTLTQARLSSSQAVYNFVVAKSNLEKTLGHDFLDDEGKVELNMMSAR